MVSDDYAAGLEVRDFHPERFEGLKVTAATRAGLQPLVNSGTVKLALIDAGIPMNETTYGIARRRLWLAYRDPTNSTPWPSTPRCGAGSATVGADCTLGRGLAAGPRAAD